MTPDVPAVKDPYQQAREHGMLLYKAFVLQLCEQYLAAGWKEDSKHCLHPVEGGTAEDLYEHIKDSICKSF